MDPAIRRQQQVPLLGVADEVSFQELTRTRTRERRNQDLNSSLSSGVDCALSALACLTFPISCCCSTVQVNANQDVIVSTCDVPTRILREPNVYWINPFCTETKEVYMAGYAAELKSVVVNDSLGNPITVSGIYGYTRQDCLSATYKTEDFFEFMREQAKTVFRKVLSKYPYDDPKNSKMSLRYISDDIYADLKSTLQKNVKFLGVKVNYFKITTLAIEEKMQKRLLARQEAQAYINGRKIIAEGAVGIVENTVQSLKKKGIKLSESERTELVADLIYMFCTPDDFSLKISQSVPSMQLPYPN